MMSLDLLRQLQQHQHPHLLPRHQRMAKLGLKRRTMRAPKRRPQAPQKRAKKRNIKEDLAVLEGNLGEKLPETQELHVDIANGLRIT